MKNNLLLTYFFVAGFLTAQKKDIEVIYNKVNNDNIILIKNNTQTRQKISLTVKGSGYQNINSPIIRSVEKGDSLAFATVKPKGTGAYTFNTSYIYEPDPTTEELTVYRKKLENHLLQEPTDFSKGIFVFIKDGCSRSQRTLSYLVENNIDFKYINTTKNMNLNNVMWEKLYTIGISKDVTMPVIIQNGKLSHSHQNLNEFLKTIK